MAQQNRSSGTCFMCIFMHEGKFLLNFRSKFGPEAKCLLYRVVCSKGHFLYRGPTVLYFVSSKTNYSNLNASSTYVYIYMFTPTFYTLDVVVIERNKPA